MTIGSDGFMTQLLMRPGQSKRLMDEETALNRRLEEEATLPQGHEGRCGAEPAWATWIQR